MYKRPRNRPETGPGGVKKNGWGTWGQKPRKTDISDAEVKRLGLPCIGAHAAMLGIVAAKLKLPVRVATGEDARAYDFVLTKMS